MTARRSFSGSSPARRNSWNAWIADHRSDGSDFFVQNEVRFARLSTVDPASTRTRSYSDGDMSYVRYFMKETGEMQALRQAAKLAREIVQCKTNQVGRAALFSLPRLRVKLSQLLRAVAELFVNGNDVPPFTVDQARCLRFVDCLVSHRHYALVMARDAAALAQLERILTSKVLRTSTAIVAGIRRKFEKRKKPRTNAKPRHISSNSAWRQLDSLPLHLMNSLSSLLWRSLLQLFLFLHGCCC